MYHVRVRRLKIKILVTPSLLQMIKFLGSTRRTINLNDSIVEKQTDMKDSIGNMTMIIIEERLDLKCT